MKKSFFFAFCLSYLLTYFPAFADLDTLWVRKQHTAGITDLWFSKSDTLKSVAADGQVITWKAATGEVLHKWTFLPSGTKITDAVFSPNGKILATNSEVGIVDNVQLWNIDEERLIGTYIGGTDDGGGVGLVFTSGSDQLAVGGSYWTPHTRILSALTAQEISKIDRNLYIWRYSPDGQEMAAYYNGNVTIIDTNFAVIQHQFSGRSGALYSKDGRYFATIYVKSSTEYWIEIYETKTWSFINKVIVSNDLSAMAFSPGGNYILTSIYGSLSINNIETNELIKTYSAGSLTSLLVSPDSSYIACGNAIGSIAMRKAFWSITSVLDSQYSVSQNYLYNIAPNPIHDNSCNIRFHLSSSNTYRVTIFITDTLGRSISVVQNQNYQSSENNITFDVSSLSNGVYTCTMQIDGHTYSQQFTISR